MMPKRFTCQVILLVIWLLGLITAVGIYESAILTIKLDPKILFSGEGAPPAGWLVPTDWESKMADKYETPLSAIYTPWLLVMVGAVLAGVQRGSADRISGLIFATTAALSLVFNAVLCLMLWEFLFHLKPLDNEIPSKSPLVALLISIIGAFVTYNFPKVEEHSVSAPAPNPPTPPN